MELRSGYTTGVGMMPEACKPYFEEGARLIFRRWTALALAVEGQWGGAMSKEKANALVEGCIEWFYRSRGASRAACGAVSGLRRAAAAAPVAGGCAPGDVPPALPFSSPIAGISKPHHPRKPAQSTTTTSWRRTWRRR
jgi:hypothetical protein